MISTVVMREGGDVELASLNSEDPRARTNASPAEFKSPVSTSMMGSVLTSHARENCSCILVKCYWSTVAINHTYYV